MIEAKSLRHFIEWFIDEKWIDMGDEGECLFKKHGIALSVVDTFSESQDKGFVFDVFEISLCGSFVTKLDVALNFSDLERIVGQVFTREYLKIKHLKAIEKASTDDRLTLKAFGLFSKLKCLSATLTVDECLKSVYFPWGGKEYDREFESLISELERAGHLVKAPIVLPGQGVSHTYSFGEVAECAE